MNWLALILLSAFCLNAFATPFDPPADASREEKASWAQARCKWRMVADPQLIGYETELHIPSEERCFLEARLTMIAASNEADQTPKDHALFLQPWEVIWDDHLGTQKICTMIPLKTTYALSADDQLKSALVDNDPAAIEKLNAGLMHDDPAVLAKLKRVADDNLAIECRTPTQ